MSNCFQPPWTVAHQTPLSMEFSRQEYWSGLPCPPPGDLPNLGIKPRSPELQADSLPSEPPGKLSNSLPPIKSSTFNLEDERLLELKWLLTVRQDEKKNTVSRPVADSFRYLAKPIQYCKV